LTGLHAAVKTIGNRLNLETKQCVVVITMLVVRMICLFCYDFGYDCDDDGIRISKSVVSDDQILEIITCIWLSSSSYFEWH
jgi:hypothetical protein